LGLSQVIAINDRAEILGREDNHREQYTVAIARAVAAMPILCEYLLPFVQRSGVMIAQKGESGPGETQLAENAIRVLGGKVNFIHSVALPGVVEERYLVEIEKIAPTPEKYPRRVGIPTKRPL
jgi:16S rRNA (guanine527-N7)-methyltransferase